MMSVMKHNKIYSLIIAGVFATVVSCKDESIELVPEWESGVHGLAAVTSANADFMYNAPTAPVNVDLQWVSIDSKNTVNKIEVFVAFNENYIDVEGNPAVAAHGGADGKLLRVFEGSAVPPNRTPVNFSLTQADLYTLYEDATFDYGTGAVSVFTNPDAPARDDSHPFYWEDDIRVRWVFTTDDGRVFEKWGVSVCTEFPGANCSVDLTVVCASDIENPEGTWEFDLVDTYGDGWQGGAIAIFVDGVEVESFTMADANVGGNPPISALSESFTFPGGASTLEFRWTEDTYQAETQFKITSPGGNVVADYKAGPPAGKIKLDLCLE
jgi:hypothetical protein